MGGRKEGGGGKDGGGQSATSSSATVASPPRRQMEEGEVEMMPTTNTGVEETKQNMDPFGSIDTHQPTGSASTSASTSPAAPTTTAAVQQRGGGGRPIKVLDDGRKGPIGCGPIRGTTLGWLLIGLGSFLIAIVIGLHFVFPKIYVKLLHRKLAVTSLAQAKKTPGWITNKDIATHSYIYLYFYNISNAPQFLKGAPPAVNIVGPFVYRTIWQRADIEFTNHGNDVEFALNMQDIFMPEMSIATDQTNITALNTAYATGVARKGSETNMARLGLPRILGPYYSIGLPQLVIDMKAMLLGGWGQRQGDFSFAIEKLKTALGEEATAVKWAQGGFGKGSEADIAQALGVTEQEAAYYRLLLDTGKDLGFTPALAMKLLDPTDDFAFTTPNLADGKRKGLLMWAGPSGPRAMMPFHFAGLSTPQTDALAAYAMKTVNLTEVEAKVLQVVDLPEYETVEDLAWRQFAVADVLPRLGSNNPDELLQGLSLSHASMDNLYVEEALVKGPATEAVPMMEMGYLLRTLKAQPTLGDNAYPAPHTLPEMEAQWGAVTKGQCIFDAVLTNKTYFENRIVGVPDYLVADDFTRLYSAASAPLKYGGVDVCLDATPNRPTADWIDLQAYINYIAVRQIVPLLKFAVMDNQGGLISTRTVNQLVLGHTEPLFPLSLGPDNPTARNASLLPNSPDLDGPAYCISQADVLNTVNGCELDPKASTPQRKVYRKVPSKYSTGKEDLSTLLALQTYQGLTETQVLNPPYTTFKVPEAAAEMAHLDGVGTIQHGLTTGDQFPPLVLKDLKDPPPLYMMRLKGPLPLRFDYEQDVDRHGLKLRRFSLSKTLFTPRPASMLQAPATAAATTTDGAAVQRKGLQQRDLLVQEVEVKADGIGKAEAVASGEEGGERGGEGGPGMTEFLNITTANYMAQYLAPTAAAGLPNLPMPELLEKAKRIHGFDSESFINYLAPSAAAGLPNLLTPELLEKAKQIGGDSYIDVEPVSGKTLAQRTSLQVSVSTIDPSAGKYDLFYKDAWKGPWIPSVYGIQEADLSAQDAKKVKKQIYGPEKTVKGATSIGGALGAAGVIAGLLILYLERRRLKRERAG